MHNVHWGIRPPQEHHPPWSEPPSPSPFIKWGMEFLQKMAVMGGWEIFTRNGGKPGMVVVVVVVVVGL